MELLGGLLGGVGEWFHGGGVYVLFGGWCGVCWRRVVYLLVGRPGVGGVGAARGWCLPASGGSRPCQPGGWSGLGTFWSRTLVEVLTGGR